MDFLRFQGCNNTQDWGGYCIRLQDEESSRSGALEKSGTFLRYKSGIFPVLEAAMQGIMRDCASTRMFPALISRDVVI